ncbi:hypothetical protein GW17_00057455 [Ensete ventricosum]|nr:hypothetical protein GW17_00057455 [Ensete ventricosum]
MHVVSSGQKCPAGLPGRSPVSNGPTGRIPGQHAGCCSICSLWLRQKKQRPGEADGAKTLAAGGTAERGRRIDHQRKRWRSQLKTATCCFRRRSRGSSVSVAVEESKKRMCWWGGLVPWLLVMSTSSAPATHVGGCHSHLLRRGANAGGIEGVDTAETGRVNRLATSTTAGRQRSKGSSRQRRLQPTQRRNHFAGIQWTQRRERPQSPTEEASRLPWKKGRRRWRRRHQRRK